MIIPGYEELKLIYRGPYISTYSARNVTSGKYVWIKRPTATHPSESDKQRLQYECNISAKLADTRFPRFSAVNRFGRIPASVAENVNQDGETLRQWINSVKGPIPVEQAIYIALQIVRMLDLFHQHRLVYNHMNPESLWMDHGTMQLCPVDYGFVSETGADPAQIFASFQDIPHFAYLSPEQTGQLNKEIDYRSDFYGLGVIMYEMMTGKVPFHMNDPIQWFHAHIVQQAVPPHLLNPVIPIPVSEIVMKCLSKSPEDRYQSSYGLRVDLESSIEQARSKEWATDFRPAESDTPSYFRISNRFIGRDSEINGLQNIIDQDSPYLSRFVFISGEPGIGKTSLVRELERLNKDRDRIFIYGKFDQVNRDVPFKAWTEAFGQFVRYVLMQSDEEIASWRQSILEVIGNNASLLIKLIPNLQKIIGHLYSLAENIQSVDMENRVESALVRFLEVFSRKRVSVVIVIDDLQWADPGSLKLLERLRKYEDISHVVWIGTYRDGGETQLQEPLKGTIARIESGSSRVKKVKLTSMKLNEVMECLAETFHCIPEATRELAGYLLKRTGGNPFFFKEFLRTLYTSDLVQYNADSGKWEWDLQTIRNQGSVKIPLNVVDLLVARLGDVSGESLHLLKYASCMGNTFALPVISELLALSDSVLQDPVFELVQLGLVIPNEEDILSFAHDRIRLAAYSLMSQEERNQTHYRLGMFLLRKENDAPSGDRLFEIVNHLNRGKKYLNQDEIKKLTVLNLEAGNRARSTAAFDHAFLFYQAGVELLPPNSWETDYRLIYDLKIGMLESAYYKGDFDEAERLFRELISHAESVNDRSKAYLTKIMLERRLERHDRAITTGLQALSEYGFNIPEHPGKLRILIEWLRNKRLDPSRQIYRLKQMGPATDNDIKSVMEIIFSLGPSTYINNVDLMNYLALISCRLTFKYGIFQNSGIGLVAYGASTAFLTGDIRTGLMFGHVAWQLTEKFGSTGDKYYTGVMYGAFLHHWGHRPAESEEFLLKSIEYSKDAGDYTFVGYGVTILLISRHVRGVPLNEFAQQVESYFKWAGKMRDPHFYDFMELYRHFIRNLQGKTENIYRFDDGDFREEEFLKTQTSGNKKFDYLLCKIQSLYLLERLDEAWELAEEAQNYIKSFVGLLSVPEHDFYYCLTLLARMEQLTGRQRRKAWKSLREKWNGFREKAENCPSHYRHKHLLIEAEMARIKGKDDQAVNLYQKSIDEATEHGYLQNEAIAHECAARFYKERKNRTAYERHLIAAYHGYLRWGAYSKTHMLLRKHSWLAERIVDATWNENTLISPGTGLTNLLDVSAILKASQIISSQIVLEDLLEQLLTILLQHSGADRGVLMLEEKDGWKVVARGNTSNEGIHCNLMEWTPVQDYKDIAHTVVDYVNRTKELFVMGIFQEDGWFGRDRHISERKIQSVLCMPIVQRGEMTGIIYLENRNTSGIFTPHRVEVLKLLSSQIAISIQNAILYEGLRTVNSELEGAVTETAISLEHSQKEAAGALIEKAILEERNRIAEDLHDTIGHTLTSVLLQIEAGKKLMNKQDVHVAIEKLENSQKQIREGLKDLRKSLFMLKEETENPGEFVSSIETFIRKTMDYTGVQVDYHITPDIRLSASQKYVLYRALQEGITNGIRHGDARRFEFLLQTKDGIIEFVLKDDGKGSDEVVFGLGLTSMKNRVRELNGLITIESANGSGFSIKILLPVTPGINSDTA